MKSGENFSVKFGFSAKKYADSWFRFPILCKFIAPCPSHCIATDSCMRRVLRTHPCAGEPQVSTRRSKFFGRQQGQLPIFPLRFLCNRERFEYETRVIQSRGSFLYRGFLTTKRIYSYKMGRDLCFSSKLLPAISGRDFLHLGSNAESASQKFFALDQGLTLKIT